MPVGKIVPRCFFQRMPSLKNISGATMEMLHSSILYFSWALPQSVPLLYVLQKLTALLDACVALFSFTTLTNLYIYHIYVYALYNIHFWLSRVFIWRRNNTAILNWWDNTAILSFRMFCFSVWWVRSSDVLTVPPYE